MTLGKPIRHKVKRVLSILCLVSIVSILSIFLFRNTFAIWVSAFWLDDNTSIQCLDFDIGTKPLLAINTLCLNSAGLDITLENAHYFVGDGDFSKHKFSNLAEVNIQSITIKHSQSAQQVDEADEISADKTDLWSLPELLPLINIQEINIDTFLLEQPLTLSISQPTRAQLAIKGDIEANLEIGKGDISGDVNWSGKLILEKSKQIEALTQPYQRFIKDWQRLVATPVHSSFQFTGATLVSQHSFELVNTVDIENCSIPIKLKGEISSQVIISPLQINIDLSSLDSQLMLDQCDAAKIATNTIKLDSLTLGIPQEIVVSEKGISIPQINIIESSGSLSNSLSGSLSGGGTTTNVGPSPSPMKLELNEIEIDKQNNAALNYMFITQQTAEQLLVDSTAISGTLNLLATGHITKIADEIRITGDKNTVSVAQLTMSMGSLELANTDFTFTLISDENQGWKTTGKGLLKVNKITNDPLSVESITSQFILSGETHSDLGLSVKSVAQGLKFQDNTAKSFSNDIRFTLDKLDTLSGIGTSKLQGISSPIAKLTGIEFNHQINGHVKSNSIAGNHEFILPSGLLGNLFHDDKNISILIPEQSVSYLNPILQQVLPEANLIAGKLAVNLRKSIDEDVFNGNITFNNVSLEYQDYQIINGQMDDVFTLDSSGIQLNRGNISIEEINVGVPMTQFNASLSVIDSIPKLDVVQAQIIGGNIELTDYWLDNRKQLLKLEIKDIDLKKLVELQNQEGIEVTGEISGSLPIYFSSGVSTIDKGMLINDGPGKLKISNNQAFNAIKQQQQQLAFLENVEFSKLSSEVSLSDDGWIDLKIGINGINPDKKQEINFNYTHKENIFTLFKSMRITNSVQNSIEKLIKQKLSNKDNNL